MKKIFKGKPFNFKTREQEQISQVDVRKNTEEANLNDFKVASFPILMVKCTLGKVHQCSCFQKPVLFRRIE